jgi:hypothetical protein
VTHGRGGLNPGRYDASSLGAASVAVVAYMQHQPPAATNQVSGSALRPALRSSYLFVHDALPSITRIADPIDAVPVPKQEGLVNVANLWREWGFRDNPFQHTALPPSAEGKRLLVGREVEVEKILTRLCSTSKVVALEGRNGIGKTSVYNVAAYTAFKQYLDGQPIPPLIPCKQTFQLSHNEDVDGFTRRVWLAVGLTLVENAAWLREQGISLRDEKLAARWISSPLLGSVQASLQIPEIVGIGAGRSQAANTGHGFSDAGFQDLVKQWLMEIFQSTDGGGVVCCIDNLELLRTSENARQALESLRDALFTTTGLRWVFCGSSGIVYGLVSTPRLSGVMNAPIDVKDLPSEVAKDVFLSRIRAYSLEETGACMPLDAADFEFLFHILHGNIRDALSQTNDYCLWFYESQPPGNPSEVFRSWLNSQARERLDATAKIVKPRAWTLFDAIVASQGECAPGDYEAYRLKTAQAMRAHLVKLEAVGLLQSIRDEDDNRRKTIVVTPMGWLVDYGRKNKLSRVYELVRNSPDVDEDNDIDMTEMSSGSA